MVVFSSAGCLQRAGPQMGRCPMTLTLEFQVQRTTWLDAWNLVYLQLLWLKEPWQIIQDHMLFSLLLCCLWMIWTASKTILPGFIRREKEKKGNEIERSMKVIADICLRKYWIHLSQSETWETYCNGLPGVEKGRSRKRLGKRDNLQHLNWRASCSGTSCRFLGKTEKSVSLTSEFHRRHWNSQKRHLVGIALNTLLYPFRNLCPFVFWHKAAWLEKEEAFLARRIPSI